MSNKNEFQNDYYKNFIELRDNPKNRWKYREYEYILINEKLPKGARNIAIFLYFIFKGCNYRNCTSQLLSIKQIKNITQSKTIMSDSLFNAKYISPHLRKINSLKLFQVKFDSFLNEKKLIGGEFLIKNI